MDAPDHPSDLIRQALWETQRPDEMPDLDAEWHALAARSLAPRPQRVASPVPRLWPMLITVALVVNVSAALLLRHPAAQPFREFTSAAGSQTTVTLRDGTHIVLGPETRLRIPTGFGVNDRTVDLEGEAYFTVVHNSQHPFTVRARHTTITDIGTVFDVRDYADDSALRVAVAEGIVSIGDPSMPSSRLAAGDIATMAGGHLQTVHHVDVSAIVGWWQGQLVFDGTPLRDVIRDLNRTFNVQITLADTTLATHQVSGRFDHETIDQVLEDIVSVVGAEYQRMGRAIVIRHRTAAKTRPASSNPPPLRTAFHA